MTWSGSPPALAGFSGEGGENSFFIPTSLTTDVLQLTEAGNTKLTNREELVSGLWVFRIGGSQVEMPGESFPLMCDSVINGSMGQLPQLGQFSCPLSHNIVHFQEEDSLSTVDALASPKVSLAQKFHCNSDSCFRKAFWTSLCYLVYKLTSSFCSA